MSEQFWLKVTFSSSYISSKFLKVFPGILKCVKLSSYWYTSVSEGQTSFKSQDRKGTEVVFYNASSATLLQVSPSHRLKEQFLGLKNTPVSCLPHFSCFLKEHTAVNKHFNKTFSCSKSPTSNWNTTKPWTRDNTAHAFNSIKHDTSSSLSPFHFQVLTASPCTLHEILKSKLAFIRR